MSNISAQQMRLYAVSDESWLKPGETLVQVAEQLLQNGVTLFQLRAKTASHEQITAQAKALLPVCRAHRIPLIVNDDVQAALEADAEGVHVGQSDMSIAQARAILGPRKIIGTSAHSVAEAIAAEQAGADYLGCGAVFGSATKTDASGLAWEELAAICRAVSIPVIAIGGIGKHNILQLAGSGIDGVAVVSALFAAEDKATATREMLELANRIAVKKA